MSNHQRQLLPLLFFVLLAIAASAVVRADKLPDGRPTAISDWALAGLVWSDACLAKQVATTAARQTVDEDRRAHYQKVARQAERLIQAMEQFGWKQLAHKSRGSASPGSPPDTAPDSVAGPVRQRIDTETPAGQDDPGLDDERLPEKTSVDIDQYRVDDYIDETPAEARNRADALEDGVEGAIAAASDEGIAGPVAGHISRREVATRSATLPYAQDSIYDADDYDPDVDYIVENPREKDPVERDTTELLQSHAVAESEIEDDVNLLNPDTTIDGEDELLANLRRSRGDRAGTLLSRYSNTELIRPADADWVQLRLAANQMRWKALAGETLGKETVRDVIHQVRISMRLASQATDNPALQHALQR